MNKPSYQEVIDGTRVKDLGETGILVYYALGHLEVALATESFDKSLRPIEQKNSHGATHVYRNGNASYYLNMSKTRVVLKHVEAHAA